MPEFADDPKSEVQRKGEQLFWIAVLETVTYIGLFICWQIIKTDAGTKLMGWFHGWIAVSFAVMVVWITKAIRWPWWFSITSIVTGPIGAVIVAARLRKTDWLAIEELRRQDKAAERVAS